MTSWQILTGDCRETLLNLPARSVQCCVTSPPYFGLRDYGHGGQIGLEPSPDEFVQTLVGVFREVRRVLRDDGTVWLNLGDSYARNPAKGGSGTPTGRNGRGEKYRGAGLGGCKPKDLLGIPWMVAFALRADGWYLRSEVIWSKPNAMPDPARDRPWRSHETLFLLSKRERYVCEPVGVHVDEFDRAGDDPGDHQPTVGLSVRGDLGLLRGIGLDDGREPLSERIEVDADHGELRHRPHAMRSVWTVPTASFPGAHFATFPPALIEPCILAGSREGDMVLDPFNGAGTTGLVALRHNRAYIGIELNPEYADMARWRLRDDAPLLNVPTEVAA